MNLGIPGAMHSWDLYYGCWNAIIDVCDTNTHAYLPLPDPNIIDTFILCNWSDFMVAPYTCYPCDTFVWNGVNWALMMQQQLYFCCDSITYWTDQSQGFNVGLDTTGIIHNPDSLEVWWAVCANGMCYSGQGMYDYFPQIMTTDTVHICYDVMLWEMGNLQTCTSCDYLIFDQNTYSWVLFNNTPTSINELTFNRINDGKIYDMLGREVTEMQLGTIYIKNGKKFMIWKQ
jgi:hypothetical protein